VIDLDGLDGGRLEKAILDLLDRPEKHRAARPIREAEADAETDVARAIAAMGWAA
jgi:hypothetical protein